MFLTVAAGLNFLVSPPTTLVPERLNRIPVVQKATKLIASPKAASIVSQGYTTRIAQLERSLQKRSCRRQGNLITQHGVCSESQQLTYYNPFSMDRIVCGHTIKPKQQVTLPTACHEPSRLFAHIPDTTGNMAPVRLRFGASPGVQGKDFPCDIPCNSFGSPTVMAKRYVDAIDGSEWKITHSMEGPQYYDNLIIDKSAYKSNQFYSTTSYQSEVPLPYYSKAEYQIQNPAVHYDAAIKGASFLARNCNSKNNREHVVKELEDSVFRVDSLSSCLHNADKPPGVKNLEDKEAVMRQYLFYLAFENQNENDYITEKLWGPLQAGTVPVYYGAPNIHEHVPYDSIINVNDFDSLGELAVYLDKVAHNRTLYETYHRWRHLPLDDHFMRKYKLTDVHSTCRTCRWAYSRFYGLGWNHTYQSVQELQASREPCVNGQGLLTAPVQESWEDIAVSTNTIFHTAVCPITEASSVTLNSQYRRTIHSHDGVTDVEIHSLDGKSSDVDLHVHFQVSQGSSKVVTTGHVRIQNDDTRTTFLTWPPNEIDVSERNVACIHVDKVPFRIRIITEDIDQFHEGADQEQNFYGSLMIRDFLSPVETFV